MKGLEPSWIAPLEPKPSAYTNSATSTIIGSLLSITITHDGPEPERKVSNVFLPLNILLDLLNTLLWFSSIISFLV